MSKAIPGDDLAKNKAQELLMNADVNKGLFVNKALIAHTSEEFIVDFIFSSPNGQELVSRIISTPSHFKRVIQAMEDNLKRYEERFGEVPFEIVPKE